MKNKTFKASKRHKKFIKLDPIQKQKLEDKRLSVMLWNSVRIIDPSRDFSSLIASFLEKFFHWRNNEGLISAVKRLKLNHQALLNYVNKSIGVVPFIRLTSDGFPKGLLFFRDLTKSRRIIDLTIINTLCRFHRNFLGDGKTIDLRSIDCKSETPYSCSLESEIRLMTRRLLGNKTLKNINVSNLKPEFFISGKGGPSGPALLRAQGCLSAMKNGNADSQRLLRHLMDLSKLLNFNEIEDVLKVTKDSLSDGEYHSRLRCKRDRSTKNRIFATVDYLTQVVLKPLNDDLFDLLNGFGDSDATYDQGKIVPYAETHCFPKTNSHDLLFSVDLSKATDRLKRGYYQVILEELTGSSKFAELVILCMSDRGFFYEGFTYKYAEGQGMGTYCSWPLMALLHHILVQISAQRAGYFKYKGKTDIYKDYIVLGDDLVLKGSTIFENYEKVVDEVERGILNKSKCIINRSGSLNLIEFASRFFFHGKEITGISTNIVRDLSRLSPDGPLVPLVNLSNDISNKLKSYRIDDLSTIISRLRNIHYVYLRSIKKYPIFFLALIKTPSIKRSSLVVQESFTELMKIFIVCKMYRSLNDNAAEASKKIVKLVYLSPMEVDSYDCPRDEDGELLDDSILGKALQHYQIGKARKMRSWLDNQFIKASGITNPGATVKDPFRPESVLENTFNPFGEFDKMSNYISMNLTRKEVLKLKSRRIKMLLNITLSQFQKAMCLWKITSYRSQLLLISGSKEQTIVNCVQFAPMETNNNERGQKQIPVIQVKQMSDLVVNDMSSLDVFLPKFYSNVLHSERKAGWLSPVEQEISKPLKKGEEPPCILLDVEYPQCGYELGKSTIKEQRKLSKRSDVINTLSDYSEEELKAILKSVSMKRDKV